MRNAARGQAVDGIEKGDGAMITAEDRRKELRVLVNQMRTRPSAPQDHLRDRAWVLSRMIELRRKDQ